MWKCLVGFLCVLYVLTFVYIALQSLCILSFLFCCCLYSRCSFYTLPFWATILWHHQYINVWRQDNAECAIIPRTAVRMQTNPITLLSTYWHKPAITGRLYGPHSNRAAVWLTACTSPSERLSVSAWQGHRVQRQLLSEWMIDLRPGVCCEVAKPEAVAKNRTHYILYAVMLQISPSVFKYFPESKKVNIQKFTSQHITMEHSVKVAHINCITVRYQ